ncbi:DUF167 domain-containing protein [Pseudoruegeria sp. SHC-113]|uniref:DUF167 domain-containing protein n=1 Tax=Pseudoruegeria sp. SHC-113 TaxID=2855439 RepID=UPI0021BAD7C9|nr:DUF167 domain-containing protein [Pseudoruegeria sp. SHC-113]MCT8159133.1 DUF167 domain-containing protein [Pseudoruegeria sp. SHC-113]
MSPPDHKAHLARLTAPGCEIAVKVTPKAARNGMRLEDGVLKVSVTAVPEKGKANEAVRKLLAKEMGIAKSRLALIRGDTSREKVFRVLD